MARKVQLKKKINGSLYDLYPKTSADVVILNSGDTVEASITSIKTDLSTLQNTLAELMKSINGTSVYLTDTSSQTITDDEGTGLVPIF